MKFELTPSEAADVSDVLSKFYKKRGTPGIQDLLGCDIDEACRYTASINAALRALMQPPKKSEEPDKLDFGWAIAANGRKAHFYEEQMSLCRKYSLPFGGVFELGLDSSPDNCAECKRRVAKKYPDGTDKLKEPKA